MTSATTIQPKDRDVYSFSYSSESREKAKHGFGGTDLNWCFDGQLIYRDGLLCDTYWGFDWRGENGRCFTVADASAKGKLTFLCNLSDVEKIREDEFALYADGDAFNLSHQHGCYRHYVKRMGAKRDKDRQIAALMAKVEAARYKLDSARRDLEYSIERQTRLTPLIEAGQEPSI